MKYLLPVLLALALVACTFTPPKPTSYEGAPRVPINQTVTLGPTTSS